MIQFLAQVAARWIRKQNDVFYSLGEPLEADEKHALSPYFDKQILEKTRKLFLNRIHPPDLPRKFRLSLLKFIFRLNKLAGLTLSNCVFLAPGLFDADPKVSRSVLFHELVHVSQYDLLSPQGFIKRYFQSWADNGYSYHKISLERVAYGLTHHYDAFPDKPFSVKERVIQGLEIK